MHTKVFCALDTTDMEKALTTVRTLADVVPCWKLGLEFFTALGLSGVETVREAVGENAEIFLDLKLHDIPNTVAGSLRAAMRCRPQFITVHTSGGREMLRAAHHAAQEEAIKLKITPPKILGVTVLTHLDGHDLERVGQGHSPEEQVSRLAGLAKECGLEGIVCSPHEIARMRRELGPEMILVVPGIRPADSEKGDQKRTMTPREAADLGANYLVIGRPITAAADSVSAARKIMDSLHAVAA